MFVFYFLFVQTQFPKQSGKDAKRTQYRIMTLYYLILQNYGMIRISEIH